MITRRQFVRWLGLGGTSLLAWTCPRASTRAEAGGFGQNEPSTPFVFAQVRYRGGDWDPHPSSAVELLKEVERRTSIEASAQRHPLTLDDPDLFSYPFLYLAGALDFAPFTEEELVTLRRFLNFAGFMLVNDASGYRSSPFDRRIREEVKRIFPDQTLERLPFDHAVFRSYYLVRTVTGRRLVNPSLEGVTIDDWTPLIYCQNDLGGAWERDHLGRWVQECMPGGEPQRFQSFMLGVNIVMYSLTENYKKDKIHIPFIKRKLG
ncbi:MAG: DUF4159 domain-containing protein [Nitrospinae bacterium]|nr:DUF4159 domain-containing protein [Nitrospinota bacterium]